MSLGTETTESTEIAGQRLAWGYTGTETVETEGNVSLKIPPFQGGGEHLSKPLTSHFSGFRGFRTYAPLGSLEAGPRHG